MKKPHNHYCHKTSPSSDETTIDSPYEMIEKIGEGAFGEVYKVFDPVTSQLKVLKRQKPDTKSNLLKEGRIMKELSSSEGFAKISDIKHSKEEQYYVMSYLGCELGSILEENEKISIYSMKRIAIQLIERLK